MNKSIKKYSLVVFLFISTTCFAQSNAGFKKVDDYVKSLGKLDTLNMGTISHILTKNFTDNTDKVRAIFDWIAYNISFDIKMYRSSTNEKMVSEDVLKTRKANPYGYAALFQDMCSVAKIRCLTVDGYVKNSTEDIGEKPDGFNHTWAVIQLGTSPEAWHYVDPAWGSGFLDEKKTTFTPEYNDAFFFAEKSIFNYQHFPNNEAWLLGPGTKDLKNFLSMPLVKNAAYEFGLKNINPYTGHIKTKTKNAVQFNIGTTAGKAIDIVSLQIIAGKKKETKTMDYTVKNGAISFSYNFTEEDTYPVNVLVNNKIILSYVVEVSE
ncbi:MAG: transglutaminase domain-containing protein [Ferruginibacter sp.]